MIRFTVVDVERPFFRELPPPATNTAYTYRDPLIRYGDVRTKARCRRRWLARLQRIRIQNQRGNFQRVMSQQPTRLGTFISHSKCEDGHSFLAWESSSVSGSVGGRRHYICRVSTPFLSLTFTLPSLSAPASWELTAITATAGEWRVSWWRARARRDAETRG